MRSDGSKRGWDGHQKNKKHGGIYTHSAAMAKGRISLKNSVERKY